MSYTVLRVIEAGVILFEQHLRRFEVAGPLASKAFCDFAATALPGIYSLRWDGEGMNVQVRGESRLRDGLPVRFLSSPLSHSAAFLQKPAPPSPYEALRQLGVATLLTSAEGTEIYEADSAAVISWRDGRFILVPSDRPRVASTVEAWLREATPTEEAPLLVASDQPIALVNAVAGICLVECPGHRPFPELAREMIRAMLPATARRG